MVHAKARGFEGFQSSIKQSRVNQIVKVRSTRRIEYFDLILKYSKLTVQFERLSNMRNVWPFFKSRDV